jgi:hypothetical protein
LLVFLKNERNKNNAKAKAGQNLENSLSKSTRTGFTMSF